MDRRKENHHRRRGGLAAALLSAAIMSGCAATPTSEIMRNVETVRVTSEKALASDLTTRTRGEAAMATAGKGAGTGLLAGGYAGGAMSTVCGPYIILCGPAFVAAGAITGAVGGGIVGAVAGGAAGSGIDAEDARALDERLAALDEQRDFSAEFVTRFRHEIGRDWIVVEHEPEARLAVSLTAIELLDREEDTVCFRMEAQMTLLHADAKGRERRRQRRYEYESLAWPAGYLLEDGGRRAEEAIDAGLDALVERAIAELTH